MSEQTEVKIGKQVSLQTLMQGVQTVVLLGSIAGAFLMVGRKDQAIDNQAERLKELAAITADLARTVSTLSATDREYAARIDSIQSRIDRLERNP
jgi:hypothetical protein